jgi:hypothetical protein
LQKENTVTIINVGMFSQPSVPEVEALAKTSRI